MKKFSAANAPARFAKQTDLGYHKLGVVMSHFGYWFVVGIVFVIYARYLSDTRPLIALIKQECRDLTRLVLVAMLGTRVFTYQWVRLEVMERTGQPPVFELQSVIDMLADTLFFSGYLCRTRTFGWYLVTGLVQVAIHLGSVAMWLIGIYVASEALLQ